MATIAQVDSFHRFAVTRLRDGHSDLSMDELLELWRLEHLSPEELAESVAAVKAAFAEIDNEDAWVDVDDHLAELRSKYGFSERP